MDPDVAETVGQMRSARPVTRVSVFEEAKEASAMAQVTTKRLLEMAEKGEPITMLTAYDWATARLVDEAGCDVILVGDSLGMVVLGYETTLPVGLEDMLHHTAAVVRGVKRALVVGDMPFLTYQVSPEQAVSNAGRFLKEAGAHAVKIEGGQHMSSTVRRLVDVGIPVMGHIGLTPQSVHQLGGYRMQGKTEEAAARLVDDALALEEAGAFAVVLEVIPDDVARRISERLTVPTIGIGAGPYCDGQVQVLSDILGLAGDFVPKHAKRYADVAGVIDGAVRAYLDEVRAGIFPTPAGKG